VVVWRESRHPDEHLGGGGQQRAVSEPRGFWPVAVPDNAARRAGGHTAISATSPVQGKVATRVTRTNAILAGGNIQTDNEN